MRRPPDERTYGSMPELPSRLWCHSLSPGEFSKTDSGMEAHRSQLPVSAIGFFSESGHAIQLASDQDGKSRLGTRHRPVQRVAFHRLAPGFANELQQFAAAQRLARGRARVVINLLFNNGAIDVIRAETQCDLRNPRRHHDPV